MDSLARLRAALTPSKRSRDAVLAVTIGLVLLFMMEGGFWVLNRRWSFAHKAVRASSPGFSETKWAWLGPGPGPEGRYRDTATVAGQVAYVATYTLDSARRRVAPANRDAGDRRNRFVLCFGDSYMFGMGVQDAETLPNRIAEGAAAWRVYDYAYPGYGAHQMLAYLEHRDLRAEIPERSGIAVYLYNRVQVPRVVGTMRLLSTFGRYAPCYELDDDSQPVYRGLFAHVHPWRTALYDLLSYEQILIVVRADVPAPFSRKNLRLDSKVIRAAAGQFRRQFASDGFYVLMFPMSPDVRSELDVDLELFKQDGLKVLDYRSLYDGMAMRLPDGHPNAEAYQHIAAQLLTDLKLGDS